MIEALPLGAAVSGQHDASAQITTTAGVVTSLVITATGTGGTCRILDGEDDGTEVFSQATPATAGEVIGLTGLRLQCKSKVYLELTDCTANISVHQ